MDENEGDVRSSPFHAQKSCVDVLLPVEVVSRIRWGCKFYFTTLDRKVETELGPFGTRFSSILVGIADLKTLFRKPPLLSVPEGPDDHRWYQRVA